MNKHLVNFIDDELKNSEYYESIRKFAEGKDWNKDIVDPIVNEYEDNIDSFGPYSFMNAIEDFLAFEDYTKDVPDDTRPSAVNASGLYEVICIMFDEGAFDEYHCYDEYHC